MNLAYFSSIFLLSSVKYLFSHWAAYAAMSGFEDVEPGFLTLFIPTFSGAFLCMLVFYFLSDFFMARNAKKRLEKLKIALSRGEKVKSKKKFTWVNKLMVKTKSKFGVYALTFIAPLFFSIPLGSIICAKFYGDKKITFPLMTGFMALYGLVMTAIILFVNG